MDADVQAEVEVEVHTVHVSEMVVPTAVDFRSHRKGAERELPTAVDFSARLKSGNGSAPPLYLYPPPGREEILPTLSMPVQ